MTAWFEDEDFWEGLYPVMFAPERVAQAEGEVAQVLQLAPLDRGAVLDLGCGPGRHAVLLAGRGLAVTGVDRSRFLLARAAERAARAGVSIDLVHDDMRRFRRERRYDLALSLFTSFGYFDDRAQDLAVLENLRRSLRPGGTLVMDLMGKEPLARQFSPTRSRPLADGGLLIERVHVLDDWARIRTEWIVVRGDRARTFAFTFNLYSGEELRGLLDRAGFTEVRLHGGLDGRPFDLTAARLVAVARAGP